MWYSSGDCRASTRHRAVMYRSRAASCERYSTGCDSEDEAKADRTTTQSPIRAALRATLWQTAQPWRRPLWQTALHRQKECKTKTCTVVGRRETHQLKTHRNREATEARTQDTILDWAIEPLMVRRDDEVQYQRCLKQNESHVSKDSTDFLNLTDCL